jgi:hypothetical protein
MVVKSALGADCYIEGSRRHVTVRDGDTAARSGWPRQLDALGPTADVPQTLERTQQTREICWRQLAGQHE